MSCKQNERFDIIKYSSSTFTTSINKLIQAFMIRLRKCSMKLLALIYFTGNCIQLSCFDIKMATKNALCFCKTTATRDLYQAVTYIPRTHDFGQEPIVTFWLANQKNMVTLRCVFKSVLFYIVLIQRLIAFLFRSCFSQMYYYRKKSSQK